MIVTHIKRKNAGSTKRAAAYCRVSTDTIEQEGSLETQQETYERVIRANSEWEYAGIYVDEGRSGTSVKKRLGFQKMIADAMAGKIDIILVKSISRFSRNIVDCMTYIEQLSDKGVSVRFERENIDSLNPACSLMFSLLAVIAQDESRSISENVRWAIERRNEQGKYRIGNRQVLGYHADENGKPVPSQDAWMIKMIFKLFAEGKTYGEVAALVNQAGGHCLRSKNPLPISTIMTILKNEIYVGDKRLQKRAPLNYLTKQPDPNIEYKSYYLKDDHEPIIDRATWEQAQRIIERLEADHKRGVYRTNTAHFLYGKLFCGVCGAPFKRRSVITRATTKKPQHRYKYWICKERQKGSAGNGCENDAIREDTLMRVIADRLGWKEFDENLFKASVEQVVIDGKEVRVDCSQRGNALVRSEDLPD